MAPRWIAEAFDVMMAGPGVGDPDVEKLAAALIERLPIEALCTAGFQAVADLKGEQLTSEVAALAMVTGIIGVLTDGDPEVVELTELYQNASKALDAIGVPRAVDERRDDTGLSGPPRSGQLQLNLAARIRWLGEQRPTRLDLQRVEAERDAARAEYNDAIAEMSRRAQDRAVCTRRMEAERDALKASNEAAFRDLAQAHREHDQLRKMYDGAAADLDRERREHQEGDGAAANREIGLRTALEGARERIAALEGEVEILRESLDSATGDAEHNERELVDLRRRFDDLQRDRDRLARDLNHLQGYLDTAERKLRDAEREAQRARHPGSW